MADNLEAQAKKHGDDNNQAHKRLLDDTKFGRYLRGRDDSSNELGTVTSTAFGRSLYALGEGVTEAPHGFFNAVQHDLSHPDELIGKAAGAALFGVGMRVLLPKSGAVRALAGTMMSYCFLKDAALPVLQTIGDASSATDMSSLHAASGRLGTGLGKFGWDSALTMTVGGLAEKGTGAVLNRTATGRAFETWKDIQFNSEERAMGRFFKWSERTADSVSGALAERLRGPESRFPDLPLDQKLELIRQASKHTAADIRRKAATLEDTLQHRKRYRSSEYSENLDDHLEGTEFGAVAIDQDLGSLGRLKRHDLLGRDLKGESGYGAFLGENHPEIPEIPGTGEFDNVQRKRKGGGAKGKGDTAGDGAAKATDNGGGEKQPGELGADNVSKMAVALRKAVGTVSEADIAVAQVKEDMKGPILSTMRGGEPPLDPGHRVNNQMLAALSDQITTPEEVKQVGHFLDHFRTANQQLELSVNAEHGGLAQIRDLNQYSRSIYAELVSNLDRLGIDRSVLHGNKAAPLFTIRDSGGAGPYTIAPVDNVSQSAVNTYPREYQGLEGVHTAGVYPHELGHDVIFGGLAKFPEELRSSMLNENVVGKAMRDAGIVDVEIQVPGAPGGVMKKSDFFVALLKAEANENTADMFGTSIDPNGGLSLAVLLASLRKPPTSAPKGPGLLETRSMYGKELVDPGMENALGIEPHGIDRWRIKLAAETLRHLSNGHEGVNKYAEKLDVLADSMSRPGSQYVWACMDEKGQYVAIPMKEWDSIIPALVKAQFDTPLKLLNNHTLRDLAPNMADRFPRIDSLAGLMADAALKNQTTVPGFDKSNHRIEEVFSAGLSGWMKAAERTGEDGGKEIPTVELMKRICKISEALRAEYRDDMPEKAIPGPKEPVKLADAVTKPLGYVARTTGRLADFQPHLRERFGRNVGTLGGYAGGSLLGGPITSLLDDVDQLLLRKSFNQVVPTDGK